MESNRAILVSQYLWKYKRKKGKKERKEKKGKKRKKDSKTLHRRQHPNILNPHSVSSRMPDSDVFTVLFIYCLRYPIYNPTIDSPRRVSISRPIVFAAACYSPDTSSPPFRWRLCGLGTYYSSITLHSTSAANQLDWRQKKKKNTTLDTYLTKTLSIIGPVGSPHVSRLK